MHPPAQLAPILWFQGPSLAGKTTLARAVQARLEQGHVACQVLDAEDLGSGLNSDNPSPEERIRRTAEMAKVLASKGWVTLVAADCVSAAEHNQRKRILKDTQLKTILMECPESVLTARAEETGRSSVSPQPERCKAKPDLLLKSHVHTPDACLERVLNLVDSLLHRESSTDEHALPHADAPDAPSSPRAPQRTGFTPNWEELRSLSQIRAKNERPEDHVKRNRPPAEPALWLGLSGSMLLNIALLLAGALGLGYLISQVRENHERAKKENGAVEQSIRVQRVLENGVPTEARSSSIPAHVPALPLAPANGPQKED
jgi:adenylylsulfate kinase-like enzyme